MGEITSLPWPLQESFTLMSPLHKEIGDTLLQAGEGRRVPGEVWSLSVAKKWPDLRIVLIVLLLHVASSLTWLRLVCTSQSLDILSGGNYAS